MGDSSLESQVELTDAKDHLNLQKMMLRLIVSSRQLAHKPTAATLITRQIRHLKTSPPSRREDEKPIENVPQDEAKARYEKSIRGPEEMDREYLEDIQEYGKSVEQPIRVEAAHSRCIVGCVCDENEGANARWFYLNEGPPQTCNCGIFYQLVRTDTPNLYGKVMGVDHIESIRTDPRLGPKNKAKFMKQHLAAEEARLREYNLSTMDEDDPRYKILKEEQEKSTAKSGGILATLKGLVPGLWK